MDFKSLKTIQLKDPLIAKEMDSKWVPYEKKRLQIQQMSSPIVLFATTCNSYFVFSFNVFFKLPKHTEYIKVVIQNGRKHLYWIMNMVRNVSFMYKFFDLYPIIKIQLHWVVPFARWVIFWGHEIIPK